MREVDPLVSEYQHDRFRPREAEALQFLKKLASLVKPIMRNHGWRVQTLAEFYPEESNLLGLNVNHGEKICVRLRHAGDERQFLPIEEIVDTLLHELCHIEIGPHNREFNALWDKLRDEHWKLSLKGYTGEGFLSEGKRLGGRSRIPPHEASRLARARADAAEKRRALSTGSGQKLGGNPIRRGTDMRKVIADAAERRGRLNNKGCASDTKNAAEIGRQTTKNGVRTKAEQDDPNERAIMEAYIEMIQQQELEEQGLSYLGQTTNSPFGHAGLSSPPPIPRDSNPGVLGTLAGAPDSQQRTEPSGNDDVWDCPTCTLKNPWNHLFCEVCMQERPEWMTPPRHQPRPQPPTNPKNGTRQLLPQSTPRDRNLLKPRSTGVQQISAIEQQRAQERPVGWICHECNNFMENHWWTCSRCGAMKQAS